MRTLCTAAFALSLFAATTADARPRPAGRALGSPYAANKTFGLGLELGNIEGLTGKLEKFLLISEELSKVLTTPTRSVGEFELKGVSAKQAVYELVDP